MKANTFIIGSQKAGTTSLYRYLAQHPDVYFSEVKEVTYFVDNEHYEKGVEWYHDFFNKHNSEPIVASSFVHMLVDEKAPERLYEYNRDSKIIICLREPVSRAHSAFHYAIKNGWESEETSFEECLTRELDSSKMPITRYHDRNYFHNGLYHHHINQWIKYFPRDQITLVKDTDLRHKGSEVLSSIFNFLGIKDHAEIDTSKEFNKAGKVRSKNLQKLILNKESKFKLMLRKSLPKPLRVWLLGNVVSKMESMNRVDQVNPEFDQGAFRKFFEEDLKKLKKDFGISFEN